MVSQHLWRVCQPGDDVSGGAALGLSAQQTSLHATARDPPRIQQARADSRRVMVSLDGYRLTCVDESGVTLAMTRVYDCALRGIRVIGSIPQYDGPHVTILATLGTRGLQAVMTIDGATDADVFRICLHGSEGEHPPPHRLTKTAR